MNPRIKEQLNQVKVASIPAFDDNTEIISISKKGESIPQDIVLNKCYLIKVARYITNPPQNFTLHQQWNKNNIPREQFYKCEVIQILGKMIKISGNGFDYQNKLDLNYHWEGWLPKQSVEIIEEI